MGNELQKETFFKEVLIGGEWVEFNFSTKVDDMGLHDKFHLIGVVQPRLRINSIVHRFDRDEKRYFWKRRG